MSGQGWSTATLAAIFAIALIPLGVTPVLPLIDLYDHVARFFVLAHIDGSALLQRHYVARWSLLPNIGVDILGVPLLAVMPPLIAAKIIVALVMAIIFSGVLSFHRAVTGSRSLLVAILLLPLLYSYILNWGFINFLLGLGLAFWAAVWWLKQRSNPRLAVPVACIWSVAIFLCHGVAFALYGLMVVAIEIGMFFRESRRDWSGIVSRLCQLAIQAVIPAILFVTWAITQTATPRIPTAADPTLPPMVHNGLYRLSTILRVEEGPAYWFDVVTLAIQGGAVLFLLCRRQAAIALVGLPLLALATVLMIAVPSKMFGAFYISDRMPLFAALCFLGCLSFEKLGGSRSSQVAVAFIVVVVLTRIAAISVHWHGYGDVYSEFASVSAKIPEGALTTPIMVGAGHHETKVPRCEMYNPILVATRSIVGPLFTDVNQQPLIQTGKLKRAVETLQMNVAIPGQHTKDFTPYMQGAAKAGFEYLIVCNADLLDHALPNGLAVVAQSAHFYVLRSPAR